MQQDSKGKAKETPENLKAEADKIKAAEAAEKKAAKEQADAAETKPAEETTQKPAVKGGKPQKYVKCLIERTRFDQNTGKKVSRERVRHVPEKQFKSFKKNAEQALGYKVKVIS